MPKNWVKQGIYWKNKNKGLVAWVFYGGNGYMGMVAVDDTDLPPYKRGTTPVNVTKTYKGKVAAKKALIKWMGANP